MISKELLGVVLGYEINEFEEDLSGEYDPILHIDYIGGVLLLNQYELMHICKKWASGLGYVIVSSCEDEWIYANAYVTHKSRITHKLFEIKDGASEIDVVNEASEFILKRIKNDTI